LLGFLEFLKSFKESEMREREIHNYFYIGSLNHRATSSLPGQPEPDFHYIQKFYKSHTKITLLNNKTHKIFDSQKSRHTPYKNHTYRPKITLDKPTEAREHSNMMVVVPSQPYMCSSSYSQGKIPLRSSKINQDLQNTSFSCVLQRERAF